MKLLLPNIDCTMFDTSPNTRSAYSISAALYLNPNVSTPKEKSQTGVGTVFRNETCLSKASSSSLIVTPCRLKGVSSFSASGTSSSIRLQIQYLSVFYLYLIF